MSEPTTAAATTANDALAETGVALLNRFAGGYKAAIEGLSAEALNWTPGPDTNSLAVLVTHAWKCTVFWLWGGAGRVTPRDRDAEFRARAEGTAELVALIDSCLADCGAALDAARTADLTRIYTLRNSEVTGMWAIVHAIEHCAEHLGHAGLTRQLIDQQGIGGGRAAR